MSMTSCGQESKPPRPPMPTDNRATAERIAREVYEKMDGRVGGAIPVHMMTESVLAGMAHRDRTAEREAVSKALGYIYGQFAARPVVDKDVALAVVLHALQSKEGYLAAEFDAGERVTLSDGSVVTLSGCGNYLVVTSHSEPPRTWRVDQWRHVPHTGADFDAVKRLAEQRGAER